MPADLNHTFPLNILAPALRDFQPPRGDFDPLGDWTHRYGLYTIGQRALSRVGDVVVRRRRSPEGALLAVSYRKRSAKGFDNVVDVTLHCRRDELATPRRGSVAFESLRLGGETVAAKGASTSRKRIRNPRRSSSSEKLTERSIVCGVSRPRVTVPEDSKQPCASVVNASRIPILRISSLLSLGAAGTVAPG